MVQGVLHIPEHLNQYSIVNGSTLTWFYTAFISKTIIAYRPQITIFRLTHKAQIVN
mgnify:CR=1 FL=1